MEKQWKRVKLPKKLQLGLDGLAGSFKHTVENIEQYQLAAEEFGFRDLSIEAPWEWGMQVIYVYGKRLETDKEYQRRLEREAKANLKKEKANLKDQEEKDKQLEERRELYQMLKKEFEGCDVSTSH